MADDRQNSPDEDFFRLAERLEYASSASLHQLRTHCQTSSTAPETASLQKGLLDATQIEIISTLSRPTDTIPGYEILDVLGRGGMGVVFRARQINLDRIVALKTVLISRMGVGSALTRFEQEARMVAQLRHPNIVGGYDFGRHEGRVFFAMELVDGILASDLIKSKGMVEENLAWGIARQTAAGLAHAANQAVVHRDIKPGNLLLIEPPEGMQFPSGMPMVKITDFGLAILTEQKDDRTHLTSDNTTVGSPHYMAPEQFENSEVTSAADIYSLGVTVFHLLAGTTPFSGSNITKVMASKLAGRFTPLSSLRPDLSDGTCDLVEQMMAHEPGDRPATYTELINKIDLLCPDFAGPSGVVEGYDSKSGITTRRADASDSFNKTDVFDSATRPSLAAQATSTKQPSLRFSSYHLLATAVLLLGCVAGGMIWGYARDALRVPQRVRMENVGPDLRIFNGQNTVGWQQRSGNWIVPRLSATLHGTNGLLARTLFVRVDGKAAALVNYRLMLQMERADADSAEIQFGFVPDDRRNGPRYVLRLDEQGFRVGQRASDNDAFVPLADIPSRPHRGVAAVALEAQPGGWFISINEKWFAAVRRRRHGELPEVRIAASGSTPGKFSDITVTRLRTTQSEP